jgi:DNA recombination protein RmuC
MNHFLLFTLSTICLILLIPLLWLYHRATKIKIQSEFLLNNNIELVNQKQTLEQENIRYIQKIEQLNTKIEYLNKLNSESDKARLESFANAKAALFDLGGELSKQLIDIHKKENQEARTLSENNISTTTEKFNKEFERLINMIGSLTKDIEQSKETVDIIKQSLLSPSGAGLLAEITLENILKASGLRANLDFIMQYSFTTIQNSKLRPDAMIFLPSGNLMIIDAKASKFLVDNNEALGNLSKTMNSHLKSLNNKEYAENILANFHDRGINFSNIITLMFLPTEQAVEKIMDADSEFMNKAWAANIFPVGPAGLMNMLSFAKFQISDNLRSENHKLIIEEVRKLLGSIAYITDYSQKLGNNIQSMVNNYDKFAASFNRYFLSRAKKIQKLGVDIGTKNTQTFLERYQLVSSKNGSADEDSVDEPLQIDDNSS